MKEVLYILKYQVISIINMSIHNINFLKPFQMILLLYYNLIIWIKIMNA